MVGEDESFSIAYHTRLLKKTHLHLPYKTIEKDSSSLPYKAIEKDSSSPTIQGLFSRYEDFIPKSIGKRTCISATSDGNCIFNAFPIALYGSEDESFSIPL
jgi:hypothetical protein